jgi:hypothetical protein
MKTKTPLPDIAYWQLRLIRRYKERIRMDEQVNVLVQKVYDRLHAAAPSERLCETFGSSGSFKCGLSLMPE